MLTRGLSLTLAYAILVIAPSARAQFADESACLAACTPGGSCAQIASAWACTCAAGFRLAAFGCVDIDECVESYESAVFSSRVSYLAAVAAAQFDATGVETFDLLGLNGTSSSNSLPITTSPILQVAFDPLWTGRIQQPTTNAVGGCGGAVSSGAYAMLNNVVCSTSWAGPPQPPILFRPLNPDVAIVGAGVFNSSVDDKLIMTFYGEDGSVLKTATIPAGAPAFVGVIAQVPATAVSIGPSSDNTGNGLIAFDNLELATRPRGRVGGHLCGADATCVNTPGGYLCITDDCPSDPAKTAPGVCGCGELEVDANGDGIVDCGFGLCPSDAPLTATIPCGTTGVCATTFGTRSCDIMTGITSDDCDELLPELPSEICDMLDNDCDGVVDEGYDACGPGLPTFYYAAVKDATGALVGTIRCTANAGVLNCDRDPLDPDQLRIYSELICPAL